MARVALAAGSAPAAECGIAAVRRGGNAVDAAIAATFATWVCEPALTSPGSGGFCTVWPPGAAEPPRTIDGFIEMPGRDAPRERFGRGTRIEMSYGGGAATIAGPGSIGTPGALAAIELLWRRWGTRPWREIIEPAIHLARCGFPLPRMSHRYFQTGGTEVLSLTEGARRIVFREDGARREPGETLVNEDLARSLEMIAEEGAAVLYQGILGDRIADWVTAAGGLLGRADLAAYRAIERPCLVFPSLAWTLAFNPPPAVGGLVQRRVLELLGEPERGGWSADGVAALARAMETAFSERAAMLDEHEGMAAGAAADGHHAAAARSSPSTSHASAVDADGLACSITTSTGYSSGIVVPGTGILLNNTLGELELCPGGYHAARPGERLRSNMNPAIARRADGAVIAFGAAGADRIASAMIQVWLQRTLEGSSLAEAVAAPRCHVEWREGRAIIAHEPGVPVERSPLPRRPFEEPHMYFGGVQAAERGPDGRLTATADPRRDGRAAVA